jgi:hypothetical protein
MCPEDNTFHASYPNASGQPNRLCAAHAREKGTYEVRNRCTFTLLGGERCESGGLSHLNQLCTIHQPGYIKAVPGRSKLACRFFDLLQDKLGISVQHAHYDSLTGRITGHEHRIPGMGRVSVDGFHAGTNTVYEFHGDFWHGNPDLFEADEWNPTTKCTFGELWAATSERMDEIKYRGYTVRYVLEADFKRYLKVGNLFGRLPLHKW